MMRIVEDKSHNEYYLKMFQFLLPEFIKMKIQNIWTYRYQIGRYLKIEILIILL